MFQRKSNILLLLIISTLILAACGGGLSDQDAEATLEALSQDQSQTATETPNPTTTPSTEYQVPAGFNPSDELVVVEEASSTDEVPQDLRPYQCFPQDYANADSNDASVYCQNNDNFPWEQPRAGYDFGYNDAFRDVSRRGNIQIPTYNWVVVTGEATELPGIGSFRDPDGGAVLVVIMNAWEVPGELVNAYLLHGFWATGDVFDMSDLRTQWDERSETYVDNEYGSYSLETLATLRNHFLYELAYGDFEGQCSQASNCDTVTWVTVIRWYDGSYHLIDNGQWVK